VHVSCFFKSLECTKLLSRLEQLNGFCPVGVLSCAFKLLDLERLLSQIEHLNGFSPVWVLSCFFKSLECKKLLSHFEQLNGFSSVWDLSCVSKFPDMREQLFCFIKYTSATVTIHSIHWRRARSAFYFIKHKSGHNPEMKRKTGNPAPLPIGYGSEDSKKV
jgi:hypothetical protein